MNPALTISDEQFGSISVQFDRWDGDRPQYTWTIDALGTVVSGSDLRLGSRAIPSCSEALASLLSFLGAFAEAQSYPDSENRNLFPVELSEWASAVGSDQFSMLEMDVKEDA